MTDLINDRMKEKQNRFLYMAEKHIKKNNKKGNEGDIIEFGHRIEDYDLITQKEYINILCKSDYPITAGMTVRSLHHDEAVELKELVEVNIESLLWTLFQKIITLIYLNDYNKVIDILDEIDDINVLNTSIKESLRFLIDQKEDSYIYELFYAVIKCKHSSDLYHHFSNMKIYIYYIEKNKEIIRDGIKVLYEKKQYDPLFYICKNFKLLQSLNDILGVETSELEREFLSLNTINGVRLAFRVLQNKMSDDEKAYENIISKIANINKTDEIQYIYFCYLLKLIIIKVNRSDINEDVKEKLFNISEINLLRSKAYGINLLAECLETIFINKGLQAYNNFVELLGVNNIFEYKEEIPQIMPYSIYNKNQEKISSRKEDLKRIKNEMNLNDLDFFEFYMNSFYKYLLKINDIFSILYEKDEDRILLKRILEEYTFYGKVSFINMDRGVAFAHYENIVSDVLYLNKKNIGQIYFDSLRIGDKFSFKINRFDPRNGSIEITNFQLTGSHRIKEYENAVKLYWEILKDCFNNIIMNGKFTFQDQKTIRSVPHIIKIVPHINIFKEEDIVGEYAELWSKVLLSLKHNSKEIIEFINSFDRHKNSLFNINDNDSSFLSINRANKILVENAEATIKTLTKINIRKEDLIYIYLNSYIRLVMDIQVILKYIIEPEKQTLRLDSIFKNYRFFGELVKMDGKEQEQKIGYVGTISMRTSEYMQFFIDKEQSVTQDMINSNKMVTFRLKEYHENEGHIEIEEVWVQVKKKWLRSWAVIHDSHEQIKLRGIIKKETLEELSELNRLEINDIDFNKLIEGFTWSMNNLCYQEDILFKYVQALNNNNPFRYIPGERRENPLTNIDGCNIEQSKVILEQLIKNGYNLHKITFIYLNSYLSNNLTFDYLLKEFYNGKDDLQSLTQIVSIKFLASVEKISEGVVFLRFSQLLSNARLFVRLKDTDYSEKDFSIGQKVKIGLVEYHQKENMIGAELW